MDDSSLRIFADHSPVGPGPVRAYCEIAEPVPVAAPTPPRENLLERAVTRILDGLPEAGESVQRAFDRKERELCALFATLAPVECWALHSALSTGDRGNGVVQRVARLTSERRARLIGFIATAARRKVVAK